MNLQRTAPWIAIVLAAIAGLLGWFALAALGSSSTLDAAEEALGSASASLESAAATGETSVDVLTATATSLGEVAGATEATSIVAADVADVAASLPPVILGVSDGLEQIDASITSINALLDALPFNVGQIQGIDVRLTNTDEITAQLAASEVSLDRLSAEAADLAPASEVLQAELRATAGELERSVANLRELAADLDEARAGIADSDSGSLIVAQLVIVMLALAIIISQLPAALGARAVAPGSSRPAVGRHLDGS